MVDFIVVNKYYLQEYFESVAKNDIYVRGHFELHK